LINKEGKNELIPRINFLSKKKKYLKEWRLILVELLLQ